ncbi:MAG: hypothetical protein AAGG44_17615 [Planctomycetota bacterium]
MAREPEKPTAFDAAQLRLLKATLEDYASAVSRAATYLEAKDEKEIWIFKTPSLRRGLDYLRPFIDAVEQSLNAAASGQPLNEESRKTRSR